MLQYPSFIECPLELHTFPRVSLYIHQCVLIQSIGHLIPQNHLVNGMGGNKMPVREVRVVCAACLLPQEKGRNGC